MTTALVVSGYRPGMTLTRAATRLSRAPEASTPGTAAGSAGSGPSIRRITEESPVRAVTERTDPADEDVEAELEPLDLGGAGQLGGEVDDVGVMRW